MLFRDVALRLLGSKVKLKIALHLLAQEGPTGERELARAIGASHVAVGKALREMESVHFLGKMRIGNANIWSLKEKSYAYAGARDLGWLAKNPPLLDLKRRLEADFGEAYPFIKKVILFGSIAEGTEKDSSDIDLFLLVGNEGQKRLALKRAAEVSEGYRERYGNSLSPLVLTEQEAGKAGQLAKNIKRGLLIR